MGRYRWGDKKKENFPSSLVQSLVFPKWREGAESIRETRVNPTTHSIVSHLFLYHPFTENFELCLPLSKSLLFSRVKTRHICAFNSVSFLASYHSMSLLLLGKLLKKVNAPSLSLLYFQLISQPKANWLQFYLIIKLKLLSPKLVKTFSLLNQMIISFDVS